MTSGPEHYRLAEQLADRANYFTYGDGANPVVGQALATEALVHAGLAQTALQVDQAGGHWSHADGPGGWVAVTS